MVAQQKYTNHWYEHIYFALGSMGEKNIESRNYKNKTEFKYPIF